MKPLKVSDEMDSYCGTCKMTLTHSVVALVDGVPVRVRCLTCYSDHKPRTEPGKTTSSGKKTRKTSTPTKLSDWQERMKTWADQAATVYSISKSYSVDECIFHKKFGKGVVLRVPSPEKIIALFESGEKMLLQGYEKK